MKTKLKIGFGIAALAVFLGVAGWYLSRRSIPVLHPGGVAGQQEAHLIVLACLLALIVVVPTFALTIYIAAHYREGNHDKSRRPVAYSPDFDHSRLFESIWWGIPIIIIGILSVVAWRSAHDLDPYKALASDKQPLVIQVVSLDWKWLFIYPQQGVASVNLAEIPTGVPVDFHVTSDTVMNSFWVPGLGGQIYAMPGMDTQLHELTNKPGDYLGSPANIAGKGFSRMDFTVRAASSADFASWISSAKNAPVSLGTDTYRQLAQPSDNVPVTYYSTVSPNLYNDVVMKYMTPSGRGSAP